MPGNLGRLLSRQGIWALFLAALPNHVSATLSSYLVPHPTCPPQSCPTGTQEGGKAVRGTQIFPSGQRRQSCGCFVYLSLFLPGLLRGGEGEQMRGRGRERFCFPLFCQAASRKTQFDLSLEVCDVTQASWGLKFRFCPRCTSGGWRDGRARWGAPSHVPRHCRLTLTVYLMPSYSAQACWGQGQLPRCPLLSTVSSTQKKMAVSCPWITLFPVFFIPREAIWWSLPSQG